MLTAIRPCHKGGDLYFVGTKEMSCHILKTNAGLLMIDVGTVENYGYVLKGMKELGLSVADLKILLISHYHYDHGEAVPALRRLVEREGGELKVGVGEPDAPLLGFPVDFTLTEGSKVTLGQYTIDCLLTPGHTSGVISFFFHMDVNGEDVLCGMFGGAGINQMGYDFMIRHQVQFHVRQQYAKSLERMKKMPVEMLVGNHVGNDRTNVLIEEWAKENFAPEKNPFVHNGRWLEFLEEFTDKFHQKMDGEAREYFVNYAHRGFSAKYPGNTLLAFRMGFSAGANGCEMDVRRSKDGELVLSHDKSLKKFGHPEMLISECTVKEIDAVMCEANGPLGGVCTLSEVLANVGFTSNHHYAIELKSEGLEEEVAKIVSEFNQPEYVIITSFHYDYLQKVRKIVPMIRCGYLCEAADVTDELLERMVEDGIDQLCPEASVATAENVEKWHHMGFTVRPWNVPDEETMKRLYDANVDGMTVDFPDKLAAYIKECAEKETN